ncbi:MAG: hypothetical protein QXG40_04370 [Ignisphaera sp.]
MGKYRKCVLFKETPRGRRCARYESLRDIDLLGELEANQTVDELAEQILQQIDLSDVIEGYYRRCVEYKMTPRGRRCARYETLR